MMQHETISKQLESIRQEHKDLESKIGQEKDFQIQSKAQVYVQPRQQQEVVEIARQNLTPKVASHPLSVPKELKRKEPKPKLETVGPAPSLSLPEFEYHPQTMEYKNQKYINPQQQQQVNAKENQKKNEINLHEQAIGYSEVEEILSLIDVALQHNDSIEQIKNSLLTSGYSKESIERAISQLKMN